MRIAIRADSGLEMGTGHVMRCLTLARALRNDGHEVVFVCKAHEGHIVEKIKQDGFCVFLLKIRQSQSGYLAHSNWLGGSQEDDALQTLNKLPHRSYDLVIVDHYGIDHQWEVIIRERTKRILVIDDLADRKHSCDFLLDQTFLRNKQDYKGLIQSSCQMMLGTQFALLRPEFSMPFEVVQQSRRRAIQNGISRVLIMMGGTDYFNVSAKALDALVLDPLVKQITVVLGPTAPHIESIKRYEEQYEQVGVCVDASNVAELMLGHDVCLGAAGSASWERCALGLPSILTAFADNQIEILGMLCEFGASSMINHGGSSEEILSSLDAIREPEVYKKMYHKCLEVCDGRGASRVLKMVTQ